MLSNKARMHGQTMHTVCNSCMCFEHHNLPMCKYFYIELEDEVLAGDQIKNIFLENISLLTIHFAHYLHQWE